MSNDLFEKVERLERLECAENIRAWYDSFTEIMAARKQHSIIEGDDLNAVARQIVAVVESAADPADRLLAVAALGRLAAVARGREKTVFQHVDEVLEGVPPTVEVLADSDEREYAATGLRHSNREWLLDYCLKESIAIDRADRARKALLSIALDKSGDISSFFSAITKSADGLTEIEGSRARLLRVRRILAVLREVLDEWDGSVGKGAGQTLANLLSALTKSRSSELEDAEWFVILDSALACVLRIVELRFSYALHASTYLVLASAKASVGRDRWAVYLRQSETIKKVRMNLLEAALVLARQEATDAEFVDPLVQAFGDRRSIGSAMARHFKGREDVDPQVRLWWEKAGNVPVRRAGTEQRVGANIDDQIGALLVEVENVRESMTKISRAVVPKLKISDPVMASTVKRASERYTEIAQIARRLGRARKLSLTETQGREMDYNPREHVLVGGDVSGVRRIRVVRDGIRKEYGGQVRTIVKAWVKPAD